MVPWVNPLALVIARGHRAELLELAEAAFDGVALGVPAGVEDGRPPAGPPPVAAMLLLVFLDRDDRLDAALPQPGAVAGRGVRLVGHRPAGPPPWPARTAPPDSDGVHQRDELRAVAVLAGGGQPGDRAAALVRGQVDLGGQPAAGPADRLPAGFPVIR